MTVPRVVSSLAPLGLWLLFACGGTTVVNGTEAEAGGGGQGGVGGGSGGASPTGPSSGAGGCTAIVNCCDDITGEEVAWVCQGSEAVCPSGASWPGPDGCSSEGCSSNADCDPDQYCDFADDLCGEGLPGSCAPRPEGCGKVYVPTCTCDGTVAGNPCVGAAMGTDASNGGGCTPPLDTFACGPTFCAAQTAYCRVTISDVAGEPDSFSCPPLPDACQGAPSCACVSAEPCGDLCEALPSGDLLVTCPGG